MPSLGEIVQFLIYWFLTYLYGIFCFVKFTFQWLFGQLEDNSRAEKERKQPPCLSDTVYGKHRYLKVQGVKLHYVESGDSKEKLILLIHGNPGFWFCWRKQIPALSAEFRVVAVDLRGCGDSESPTSSGSYNKEVIVEDLVQLISSLGYSSAYVVCCELSGHFGWELASKHPHLVSKLVFLNAPHPLVLHHLFHTKSYYYFKYWYLLFIQIPILPELMTSKETTSSWLSSILEPLIKAKVITEEEIEAYKYTYSRKDDWRGVIQHFRQIDLRPLSEKPQPCVVTTPTLILMGSSHPYLTVEAAYRSAELVERIKVKSISGAANNLQVTHYSQTNKELLEFLRGPRSPITAKPFMKPSLVGRVFGAVTSPYSMRNTDVVSISNGLKEAAQNTLNSGVNLAQTVWPNSYKENHKLSQLTY